MEEVTRKFFEMCSNCITGSVPLSESDGSINHNLLEADGVRPECVCGNDCAGDEISEIAAAAGAPSTVPVVVAADEILRSA